MYLHWSPVSSFVPNQLFQTHCTGKEDGAPTSFHFKARVVVGVWALWVLGSPTAQRRVIGEAEGILLKTTSTAVLLCQYESYLEQKYVGDGDPIVT